MILDGGVNPIQTKLVRGMRYKVFDMNGVFLDSGAWTGSFNGFGCPVILKFEGGQTVVFR